MRSKCIPLLLVLLTIAPVRVLGQVPPVHQPALPDASVMQDYRSPSDSAISDAMTGKFVCLDTEALAKEQFRWQALIVPGVLLGAGVIGSYSSWFDEHVNDPVRNYALELSGGRPLRFDDYIQYIPIVTFAGLGFAVEPQHSFKERLCIIATGCAVQGLMTTTVKYTIRHPRPDNGARNSFPSGHTASVFMGAEMVRLEYGRGWGAGAYVMATATCLMRVYNDRHWISDLLGGAGIGILSADIACWILPWERRWFDEIGLSGLLASGNGIGSARSPGSRKSALSILPTPYGISVSCVF